MMIDLDCTARLEITECTDGWNIEILNPKDVRIGIRKQGGIHFKYVTDVLGDSNPLECK